MTTAYVIRLKRPGVYHGENFHWEQDIERAKVFESMTEAVMRALGILGLEADQFEILPVRVKSPQKAA